MGHARRVCRHRFISRRAASVVFTGAELMVGRDVFNQMPSEMSLYVEKVMKSLDKQEEKLNDASLTPSGLIVDQLQNSAKTWEELNLELAQEHSNSLKSLETDLNYLSEEAKSSLEKFKQLGNHQEEEFDVYLDKFVNDI